MDSVLNIADLDRCGYEGNLQITFACPQMHYSIQCSYRTNQATGIVGGNDYGINQGKVAAEIIVFYVGVIETPITVVDPR